MLSQHLQLHTSNHHQVKFFGFVTGKCLCSRNPDAINSFFIIVQTGLFRRCLSEEKAGVETSRPPGWRDKSIHIVDVINCQAQRFLTTQLMQT